MSLAQYESNAKHSNAKSKRAAGLNDVALQNGPAFTQFSARQRQTAQQHSDTAALCHLFTLNLPSNTVNPSDYRKDATMAVRAQFENSNE